MLILFYAKDITKNYQKIFLKDWRDYLKKTSKKFLYTILCLGLLASLSTSAASFAALENFGCGSYSCYNGCPYYSDVGGFDYNSITKEYLETNKEDYIDKWDCYPGGQFFCLFK